MPPAVKKAMLEWCNRGNPSAGYASARDSRKMMLDFRQYIGKLLNINPCCAEDRDSQTDQSARRQDPSQYKIIFTSGGSESNCTVLHGVVNSYAEITGTKPHVIISAIEHKSILDMVKSYSDRGIITATIIAPTSSGHIRPADVSAAVAHNTCLICVMHANNETGAINDIQKIGQIAHKNNILFHCDTVQTFGRITIDPVKYDIDSLCVSFHKIHGPPGIGALIVKQQMLAGWKFPPLIFGTQNENLRGGTENLPGIGASFAALRLTTDHRLDKTKQILQLKKYIIAELAARMPTRQYALYLSQSDAKSQPAMELVFLSGNTDYYLPNTILLSVVKRTKPPMCNSILKSDLEKKGIVISIGSACNTASARASHVLYAMGADELIRRGTLRITLGDENTAEDAKKLVQELLLAIKKQN